MREVTCAAGFCVPGRLGHCPTAKATITRGGDRPTSDALAPREKFERDCLLRCLGMRGCRVATVNGTRSCSLYPKGECDSRTLLVSGAITFDLHDVRRRRQRWSPTCSMARRTNVSSSRQSPLPEPSSKLRVLKRQLKLGVATLLYNRAGKCTGISCGLLSWCAGARRLLTVLSPLHWQTTLLVLAPELPSASSSALLRSAGAAEQLRSKLGRLKPRTASLGGERAWREGERSCIIDAIHSDCPPARVVTPSPELSAALRRYLARRAATLAARGNASQRQFVDRLGLTLFKWQFFAPSAYDAVLYSDLDVELLPPLARLQSEWLVAEWASKLPPLVAASRTSAPSAARGAPYPEEEASPPAGRDGREQQLARGLRLLGQPDGSSPINGGLLWLFPDKRLYEDGVSVLGGATFEPTRGWVHSRSRPAELGTPSSLLGRVPLRHADGSVLRHKGVPARVDDAAWSFVGADVDQVRTMPMPMLCPCP